MNKKIEGNPGYTGWNNDTISIQNKESEKFSRSELKLIVKAAINITKVVIDRLC